MKFILLLVALLLAMPALAVDNWGCSTLAIPDGSVVHGTNKICYDFSTSAEVNFSISGSGGLACLQPEGETGHTIEIHYCPSGVTTTIGDCIVIRPAGGILNGIGGTPLLQQACVSLQRGIYVADITVGTGTALFLVEGSE